MTGVFGIAELMENRGDCAVLFDTNNMDMKVVNTVYRSIITKRNKKKEVRKQSIEEDKKQG